MTIKVALITGITGQDGAYLTELLLGKDYEVHGIKRRSSSFNTARIDKFYQDPHEPNPRLVLHYGDMTDATNLIRVVQETQPPSSVTFIAEVRRRSLKRAWLLAKHLSAPQIHLLHVVKMWRQAL